MSLISPNMTIAISATTEELTDIPTVDQTGYEVLGSVESVSVTDNKVTLTHSDGNKTRISVIDENLFRYYVDINDSDFQEYPTPNKKEHRANIVVNDDDTVAANNGVEITVEDGDVLKIKTSKITIEVEKSSSKMTVRRANGSIVMQEAAPIMYKNNQTIQSLVEQSDEYFYGGGTQNGRFSHKGEIVKAINSNNWVDGGVASPNPFYWTTKGYGIVRNTFKPGEYDFGKTLPGVVSATHNESRFDAYIMVDDNPQGILNSYTNLTGKPAQQPDYAFYLAHLNCYNRDVWKPASGTNGKKIDGQYYTERQAQTGEIQPGEVQESLMEKDGNKTFTAQRQIELHEEYDLPIGAFYPNDGYGCGYGQSDSFDGDIAELKAFTDFANSKGLEVGLWTQANLWPGDKENPKKGERDIQREVQDAGVRAVKTDVAWVGAGYSMALDGVQHAYNAITELSGSKANIISLDGWAGTQRYAGIWSGDQSGGNWEYIRFHIPTYIGTGLSGMPNIGSDLDGIFGGKNPIIQTRDFQWKAFTPYMLDMDGWGASQKNPWEFGEDTTSINRAYLKLKAEMMPYISTISHEASQTGMPLVRAMMLEYPDAHTYTKATQYQYMWGSSFLVAPIYQDTASDAQGNDIRNDIYLPDSEQIWIDYFTGDQYRGGSVLNNFDAPIWKTPVFVKNGSIVPMYAENNNPRPVSESNPKGLDKSHRIVEFYPNGNTTFNLYEDDGITLDGASTNTVISSSVSGDQAILSIGKATGTYPNMVTDRDTEMIVNVSQAPQGVRGNVAGNDVTFTKVTSKEAYDAASGNVYFYDETPVSIVSEYATEGTTFDTNKLTTRPKVFIKSTDKINVHDHEFTVTVDGFANDQDVSPNTESPDLAVPTNLTSPAQTSSTITLDWDDVNDAKTYDVEIEGTVFSNIKTSTFTHNELNYDTEYSYRVRAVNETGHSKWTAPITVKTALDPYRNVPKNMTATWTGGGGYAGTVAQDAVDGDEATQFHSATGGDAYTNTFTIDMQKSYQIEKLEYVPRPDFGNGTIRKFEVDYSLDGETWKSGAKVGVDTPAWSYSTGETMKTLTFDQPLRARYLRISVKDSVGGFFTAHELRPYAVEGSPSQIVGDWNNSGTLDEEDLIFFENYAGLKFGDADFEGYVDAADINYDNKIDAYDISFVARQLNGGVTPQKNKVQGQVLIVPSVTEAEAGDVVTYTVYGMGMENVYALDLAIPYNDTEYKFESNSTSVLTQFMKSFSKDRLHTDKSRVNYLIFTNVGPTETLNGTGVIGSFKMTQKFAGPTAITPQSAQFVGDNLSTINALNEVEEPVLPSTETKLTLNEIEGMTFTNDLMPTDDGTNGAKLWQQGNYASLLFDGKVGELAEFKWKPSDGDLPDYVKLPTTMTFKLKESHPISKVRVHNRPSGSNGSVTSIKATAYSGDTAIDLGTISTFKSIFEWNVPEGQAIDRIEITPLTASGSATGTTTGTVENRMLSLYEIDFISNIGAAVSSIEFDAATPDHIGLESLTRIQANVGPKNAINPFYEITSSDPSVATITKIVTEKGYEYYITGKKAGNVVLTATSLADASITVDHNLTVSDRFDTTMLEAVLAKTDGLHQRLYTEASYTAVMDARTVAQAVLDNPQTISQIEDATIKLNLAFSKLQLKGSNTDQVDSIHPIDTRNAEIVDFTNQADTDYVTNILDNDPETIWHTSYGTNAKLPISVTVDLKHTYNLEQLNFLPNTRNRNGDIVRYRIETSLDGETFEPVVEDTLPYDVSGLIGRSNYQVSKFDKIPARYVKFIALESLGTSSTVAQMNKFASMAEMKLFGELMDTEIAIESIVLTADKTELNINDTQVINAALTPADATEAFTWTSSDETIASVVDGVITAHKPGVVTVQAHSTKGVASNALSITVKAINIDSLKTLAQQVTTKLSDTEYVEQLHEALYEQVNGALDAATTLIQAFESDPQSVTANDIQTHYNTLQKAFNDLAHNGSVVQLETLATMDLAEYDSSTTSAFIKLQEKAVEMLDDILANLDTVAEFVAKMETAQASMVRLDRQALDTLVNTVAALDTARYTPLSVSALNTALESAQNALSTATTQQTLNEALTALETAYNGLVVKANPTQRQTLQDFIDVVAKLNAKDYKATTFETITTAASTFTDALAQENLSDLDAKSYLEMIPSLMDLINNPDGEITPNTLNKDALNKLLESIDALSPESYTESSWNTMLAAKAQAEAIANNPLSTQIVLDEAVAHLQSTVNQLVKVNGGVIEGFKGLPDVIRVGEAFTLYPEFDDLKGGEGWIFDAEFFAATFNSPATFIPLKTGTTTISFTSSDGTVQRVTVTIKEAVKKEEEKETNTNTENPTKLPATGVATHAPFFGVLIGLVGAIILLSSKKRKSVK